MWQQLHKLTLHQDFTFTVCFCRVSESSSSSCQSAVVLQTLFPSSHSKSNIFMLTMLLGEMWKTPSIHPYDTYVKFWRQKCAWIKRTSKANSWSAFIRSIQGKFMPNVFEEERRGESKHEREHIPHQRAHVRVRLRVTGSITTILHTCDPLAPQLLSHTCLPQHLSVGSAQTHTHAHTLCQMVWAPYSTVIFWTDVFSSCLFLSG